MINKTRLTFLLGFTVFALCASVGHASLLINLGNDNIVLTDGSPLIPAGQSAGIKYWNGSAYTSASVSAGVFKLKVSNPDGSPSTGTIFTFCTDVGVWWQSGKTFEAVQFTDSVANGVAPAWSSSANLQAIQNASWLYNQYFIPSAASYIGNSALAAGMQLAIWKVLYDTKSDGTVDPSAWSLGNFQVTSGAAGGVSHATTLISALNLARSSANFVVYSDTWLHPVNDDTQGMIYNNLTPIPEPTTVIASALLLLPFGFSTWRVIRNHRRPGNSA